MRFSQEGHEESRVIIAGVLTNACPWAQRHDTWYWLRKAKKSFRRPLWATAIRAAGITPSFRPRDMRHTAISPWIAAGIDVRQVSVLAGHESISFMLDRYGTSCRRVTKPSSPS
jgi:integrase